MMPQSAYRVPSSAYVREYLKKYGRVPAVIVALLLIVAFFAGFNDMRWWLVGLMGLFVVLPMIFTMGCFIAAGRKDMAVRLHPQAIRPTDKGFELSFFPFEPDDENNAPVKSVLISADNISRVIHGGRYARIIFRNDDPFDFVLVPLHALPSSPLFLND